MISLHRFALFSAQAVDNRPTDEPYRSDNYNFSRQPSRRMLSTQSSYRSQGSIRFSDHEHFDIPDEDITTYTEEEQNEFNNFSKKLSALLDYGGVYHADRSIYGENFDIPIIDGPAYSEDEIIKFDLFQKAKSKSFKFDAVYDSDDEFTGENFDIPDSDTKPYSEEDDQMLGSLERLPSAFVQFAVYDDDEEEDYGEESRRIFMTNSPMHPVEEPLQTREIETSEIETVVPVPEATAEMDPISTTTALTTESRPASANIKHKKSVTTKEDGFVTAKDVGVILVDDTPAGSPLPQPQQLQPQQEQEVTPGKESSKEGCVASKLANIIDDSSQQGSVGNTSTNSNPHAGQQQSAWQTVQQGVDGDTLARAIADALGSALDSSPSPNSAALDTVTRSRQSSFGLDTIEEESSSPETSAPLTPKSPL